MARGYFKLLAYKDEYEVARLMVDPAFKAKLAEAFEGDYKVAYNLAPPILSRPDPVTGKVLKRELGPWLEPALRVLASLKGLRGSWLDPFGYLKDRKLDRALLAEYEVMIAHIIDHLSGANLETAIHLAQITDEIRGYGHVKELYAAKARGHRDVLMLEFDRVDAPELIAAE